MLELLALAILGAAGDSLTYYGNAGELHVAPPRIEAPAVRIDGRLEEDTWTRAAVLTGFTQYEPVEGIPASESTEVLVFYTDDAIYFGIRARDRRPEEIRATLAERDRSVSNDDWVRIMLDTFDDQRQAYLFYINPLGIQTDGLWIEGMAQGRRRYPVDFSPDFIWQSRGRVTDEGWEAEIRIPYVSLRFREAPVQQWGINVAREVKRKGFKQSWAPLTQDAASTLSQSGKLVNLRGLAPRRLVELTPVVTGKRTGVRSEDGEFAYDNFQPEFGFNGRVGLTQNLVLDATINPDFSQVEADADRITVNERFDVYFPEKRPFFLDGAEIFQTPQRLVYTRRIVDPVGGAKLTGKIGSFNVGYLGALDDSPRSLDDADGRAAFNLLRLRKDVGTGSTVGVLYTDRTLTDGTGFNRVLGADARLLFRDRYTLTTQLAGSWTRTGDGAAPVDAEPLLFASLKRSGRRLGWELRFEDTGSAFRAESGFLRRIGDARLSANGRLMFYGAPGALLERWGLEVRTDNYFDHDVLWSGGGPEEGEVEFQPSLYFRGDHSISMILRDGYFRFQPEDYTGYRVEDADGALTPFALPDPLEHMLAVALVPRLRLSRALQFNGRFYFREVPLYAEGGRGLEFQLSPEIQAWPTPGFYLELSHARSRIWRRRNDTLFSTADISRLKAQYHFTRALFARAVVQYNLQSRDALLDPATGRLLWIDDAPADETEDGGFQAQLLLSYEPSPGTIFYVGWARHMTGPDTYRLARLEPASDGVFLKFSYLYRL